MAKLLLIDDDQAVRETLAEFLAGTGHEVITVGSGRQALEVLSEGSFDLIVVDVFMPDVEGMELIRLLSQEVSMPPLIAISGGGGILPPNWSLKSTEVYGVEYALFKPIDMTVFLSTVEQALNPNEINRSVM